MASRLSSTTDRRPTVTVVAMLPGRIMGLTLCNQTVVQALQSRTSVRLFPIAQHCRSGGVRWKITKMLQSLAAVFWLLTRSVQSGRALYLCPNANWGLLYDIPLAAVAAFRGYHCVLHHHVYSYISRYDRRMQLLVWLVGARATHVVLCERMRSDFIARYAPRGQFLIVPSSIVSLPCVERPPHTTPAFRLGHLSNLTVEKGLDLVLETFDRLRAAGADVVLRLAGPCEGETERELIRAAQKRHGERLEYRGSVYGVEKEMFFQEIDAFLFPTRYRNESWGIVLNEALCAGAPVLAYGVACIPYLVGDAGLVVPPTEDFAAQAADAIHTWIDDPTRYAALVAEAKQRGQALNDAGERGLEQLVEHLIACAAWNDAEAERVESERVLSKS